MATKQDIRRILEAMGQPWHPKETSQQLVESAISRGKELRTGTGERRDDVRYLPKDDLCEEGGFCEYSPDYEADESGELVTCEKCGSLPVE